MNNQADKKIKGVVYWKKSLTFAPAFNNLDAKN